MRPQPAPGTPSADPLSAALGGDAPFVVLLGQPGSVAGLDAAVAELDPVRVATVRIRNPLATPLSAQRVMLQFAPDDGEGADLPGDHAGHLPRAVTARAGGRPTLLVVVEQAETLTYAALALLQLLPGLRAPGLPAVRVAFLGTPAFRALLLDPRFRSIRDHLVELPTPSEAETPAAPPARRPARTGRLILGAAAAGAAAAGAASLAAALFPRPVPPVAPVPIVVRVPAPPGAEVATGPPAAALLPAETSGDVPQAASPPPSPAPSPAPESPAVARARLFREFDAFVEARGLAGRLSRPEREALFQEYLARRYAGAGLSSNPAAPPPVAADRRNVVLFFSGSLAGAEAAAEESAVLLRRPDLDVTLRSTARSPSDPTVNYFRPADRDFAIALALALPVAATEWQVVDMSRAAGWPARPTVEVWLPRPRPAP